MIAFDPGTGLRLHDDIEPHIHLTPDEQDALAETIWLLDNVEFTTVGIDIGSSTSHLIFSRVHLRRQKHHLSSRYVVVDRRILWCSPIRFTPFKDDNTIDSAELGAFIEGSYRDAGLTRDAVDTGAVILTGEAIKRDNARAIAALFADEAGKFVCASAGHRLEAALAAHGSGAAVLSQETGRVVLHADIGGGTTKLALCVKGRVVASCAFAVGGRLIAFSSDGRIARLDDAALTAARAAGVELAVGEMPPPGAVGRVVKALAAAALGYIRREPPGTLARDLLLTEPLAGPEAALLTFSGGVSDYLYGREHADFGDIARELAAEIGAGIDGSGYEVANPGQGIRATAIGVSQFAVQVSGKTIYLGTLELPLYNLPVVAPHLPQGAVIDPVKVAESVALARGRMDLDPEAPLALALHFSGSPSYERLHAIAQGLAAAFAQSGTAPLVLLLDGDVGRLLGRLLDQVFDIKRQLLCIDGIELRDFDFVDIGRRVEVSGVLPVIVKSLLFGR